MERLFRTLARIFGKNCYEVSNFPWIRDGSFSRGLEIRRGNKERPTSSKGINGFLARNALIKYRRDISARLASPAGI